MSDVLGVLAIGLMVGVLAIAIFSLVVLIIIPIGRFLEKRASRASEGPSK